VTKSCLYRLFEIEYTLVIQKRYSVNDLKIFFEEPDVLGKRLTSEKTERIQKAIPKVQDRLAIAQKRRLEDQEGHRRRKELFRDAQRRTTRESTKESYERRIHAAFK